MDNISRRAFVAAATAYLVSFKAMCAAAEWTKLPSGTVPLKEWRPAVAAQKVMTWAVTCLRRNGHWTFEGTDWFNCTPAFMRLHMRLVHGHTPAEANDMGVNQLVAVHDAHHEGRSVLNYVIPPNPPNGVNNLPDHRNPGKLTRLR